MRKGKKYKVLWLHPHFLNWMGGHRYIYEVTKRLKSKYNCDIVLYSGAISNFARNEFTKAGIKLKTFLGFSTNNPFYWLLMPIFLRLEAWYLRQEAADTDVVISSMFPMNVLANRLSGKTIQLCYEPFAFFYDPNFVAGLPLFRKIFVKIIKPFYNNLDKSQTINSKKVLTLSNFNKRWIARVYRRKDVSVVYEGVDTDFFKPVRTDFLKKKYKEKRIVFHSTDFTGVKGTQHLIKALPYIAKEFPKVLVLISYTIDNKEEKRRMELLAEELGVTKNIKYLGFVKYDYLPFYAGLAESVVQPSIMQSMSMSVKEAMACETPVITSLEGKEQFKDGEAGFLINPKNKTKLAEKVTELFKNKSLRINMGKEGRKIAIEKFSWESVTEKFYRNIKEVANAY